MGKKIPFDRLIFTPQTRFKLKDKTEFKPNTGLDTETYQGYCRLIADDEGNYKEVDNLSEILQFLTRHRFKARFNWFFNIKYDFEAIIKYLDDTDLYNLYHNGNVKYSYFKIKYIDKKFFSITDNHKQTNSFFDMFSFVESSLNAASKTYLQDEKLDTIDSSRLNTDWSYWENNREDIIRYCIKDANLTKRLADYFWRLMEKNLNFHPTKPFSKGRVSEEYFLKTCYIPTIENIPKEVLHYAYNNFSGGRFEILQRGYFSKVYTYDISSAYPDKMRKLYDYSLVKWFRTDEYDEESDIGFYHCIVECLETNFSPFMVVKCGLNLYPNGKFYQYLNSKEIAFIKKHFPNIKITVLKGYEGDLLREELPLKEEIERLYEWKSREKDPDIKYCVKILLNSLYGKTIQKIAGKTGKLFNPIWATLITSETRLQLLEQALNAPDDIINFSTDGIGSTTPLPASPRPKLGDFSQEFCGQGVFIMSDIYTLWQDTPDYSDIKSGYELPNIKMKNKMRGFKTYKDTVPMILDFLEMYDEENKLGLLDLLHKLDNSTKYRFKKSRPYHLGECIIQTKKLNPKMINIFHIDHKDININGDVKRNWIRDFKNGKDALENSIKSYPFYVK